MNESVHGVHTLFTPVFDDGVNSQTATRQRGESILFTLFTLFRDMRIMMHVRCGRPPICMKQTHGSEWCEQCEQHRVDPELSVDYLVHTGDICAVNSREQCEQQDMCQ